MGSLANSRTKLGSLIHEHLRRHAGFGAEDLAKLLYQGVMGMDHLLGDRERFLWDLQREWESLKPVSPLGEVRLERAHPSDPVARLNLRPLKVAGGTLGEIGPLLADQPLKRGEIAEFQRLWSEAVELAWKGQIPFAPGDLAALGEATLSSGHPPGHSQRYRELDQPSYRLIHNVADPAVRELLEQAGVSDELP